MPKHPYQSLPSHTRWTRAVADPERDEVDPVISFPFTLSPDDRVATAGSCFAQHIARHLKKSGYCYYIVEDGHPLGGDDLKQEFGYGVFSARYGNIYTTRQLLQLFKRTYSGFVPKEDHWTTADGTFLDPLRPNIQPGGFATLDELHADRRQHLLAVRRMFEGLDYFVFTLGLTEGWYDRRDGTVFPVCPGVAGGVYDETRFGFLNLRVQEVVEDMTAFLRALRGVNAEAKVILTVSPVPLAATAIDRHVLVSTTYSKSVLRVACEELCSRFPHVAYFPSYEIITGSYTRGAYFAPDLRSVTEEGVEHVMRLFFRHAAKREPDVAVRPPPPAAPDDYVARMAKVVTALCDEELIEASIAAN
jgi:hypothetical protein